MRPVWWVIRCHVTVCLEIQSTRHHEWNLQGCVRCKHTHSHAHTHTHPHSFSETADVFPALRIHVSESTIKILERTDCKFECEHRGETHLKVRGESVANHRLLYHLPANHKLLFKSFWTITNCY